MTLSSQPQQLLGQPQVMPQFLLANGPLGGAAAAAAAMQQLLIQVSTGNGAQQLLSIPLSLAAGAGGQIQLLTTSNGQIIATNLANVPQPVNIAVPPPSAGTCHYGVRPVSVVVSVFVFRCISDCVDLSCVTLLSVSL